MINDKRKFIALKFKSSGKITLSDNTMNKVNILGIINKMISFIIEKGYQLMDSNILFCVLGYMKKAFMLIFC